MIARIRGRSTMLISDWQHLIAAGSVTDSDERIWESFLAELQWLHAQMNRELRDTFAPLFALFEMKTIVLCLRNKAIGRPAEIERLLHRSLLADDIRESLTSEPDVRSAIVRAFGELAGEFDEGNLQAFENDLMRLYLQEVVRQSLHPVMREFFTEFIDLRNIVLLYKHFRWNLAKPEALIDGGSIAVDELQSIQTSAELDDLVKRVTRLAPISVATSGASLESELLGALTTRLRTIRHTMDDIGLIVVYVWNIYVQARNLAILHHAPSLDAETIERELIA
ncbi:MAG TPA: V-type ATPase subunit [Thermoanaerobaculia bacterium]|nr:V-type ATPase subunit [Thermoanaerobaculia bacterium]